MIPRILNFQANLPAETEPCEPDVHYFPVGYNVVAFDSNTLIAVEISQAQHAALTAPREVPNQWNQSNGARADERAIRRLLFSGLRPKFNLSPDVSCRQLTLHLSDQCNQRCSYCWITQNPSVADVVPAVVNSTPPVMTREIACAALSMFPDDDRDIRLAFFGGEPLLHFGLILAITEMALKRAARRTARFHVTTNATLITPVVARFLAEYGFSIIVSCDGPARLHDAARGKGSYAAMRRGLAMLHQAGCSGRIVLRGTWTGPFDSTQGRPENGRMGGRPAEILQRLGHLNELAAAGLAAGVALEPAAGADYGSELDAEIHSAANWFAARARSGDTPHWQYLEKTLSRILWQQFRGSECGAGRGYYTVGPTGLIYACHKQQNSHIGVISPNAVIDEVLRGKWLDNRLCARRECSLCWARHVCGGACRSESLEFCGSITEPHAGRCLLMRRIVAEALALAATLPRKTLLRICPAPSGSCGAG